MQTVITGGLASAPVDFAYVQIGGFSIWPFVNSHDHNRKHSIILWAWGQEECLHVTWPANKSALVHYLQRVSGIRPPMKSQASCRSVGAKDLRADLALSSSRGCVRPYTTLNLSGRSPAQVMAELTLWRWGLTLHKDPSNKKGTDPGRRHLEGLKIKD